ncbi:MAG TPA: hypothetical protein VFC82_11225 [Actinomycetaceae bacterium]|nr:hypothetical protein [Actinomycetaceae bacterium]
MPIPEDRQKAAIDDAAAVITQTRQQVQRAAHTLKQAQATLAALPAKTEQFRAEAKGHHATEWQGLVEAFVELKVSVDAAVALPEVDALDKLEV